MVTKKSKGIDRDGLIAAIRKAVEAGGGKPLTMGKFLSESKLAAHNVHRHFPHWTGALKAAGFTFKRDNDPVTTAQALEDWGRIARKLRRMPSGDDYRLHGKYAYSTLERRFGRWSKATEAFLDFAGKLPQWADVLALLPPKGAPDRAYRRQTRRAPGVRLRRGLRPGGRLADRPICGPPLDFAGLRHAPANELGVILLFGAMARSLGFLIESLQAAFPDCEAKRLSEPDTWQSVRIEFEYESRNYRDHGHPADGCDIIICWAHNWPECPKNIEVIALSDHVARLAAEQAGNN